MMVLKKIGLDVLLAGFLFIVALFLAGAISIENRDCVTCGGTIGSTFWFAAVLALQPVIWTSNLRLPTRALIWSCSLIAGAVVYIVIEIFAASLLSSGNVATAFRAGSLANVTGVLVAFAVSLLWSRNRQRSAGVQIKENATIEP